MASGDDGARQVTGTVPVGLAGLIATITSPTFNLTVAPTIPEGSEPQLGDPEDEKDCQGTFPLIMEVLQPVPCLTGTKTLVKRCRKLFGSLCRNPPQRTVPSYGGLQVPFTSGLGL